MYACMHMHGSQSLMMPLIHLVCRRLAASCPQPSLGGNAKTLIIANVSPSAVCGQETLSTLRFARQTKNIKNDARVNWTVQGDRVQMAKEIERLRAEMLSLRAGVTDPLVRENQDLKGELDQ